MIQIFSQTYIRKVPFIEGNGKRRKKKKKRPPKKSMDGERNE
jgi:hypothetical protein